MEKINKHEKIDMTCHMNCELQLRKVMGDLGLYCLDHRMFLTRFEVEDV